MTTKTLYSVVADFPMLSLQVRDDNRTVDIDDGCQIRLTIDLKKTTAKQLRKSLQSFVFFC